MPRGQKPQGEHALSNAERQARYRARHLQPPPHVVIRTRRPVDRRSRIQRWDDATNALLGIQAECVSWLEALPDSLRSTAMAEALEAIVDLDLGALAEVKPADFRYATYRLADPSRSCMSPTTEARTR